MTAPKPWTEAHRREALRRTYELAAELADGEPATRWQVEWLATAGREWFASERTWRQLLRGVNARTGRGDHATA